VVAILAKVKEKGDAEFEDVKEEVLPLARNEAKGDLIIAKIKQLNAKSLEELGNSYGAQATYRPADTITISSNLSNNYDATAVGKANGLKPGKKLDSFKGDNGVLVAEKISEVPAQPLADYTALKQGTVQNLLYKNMSGVSSALNELLHVEDNRYQFY
ncbi:MAG TPA: hypothetical protein VL947_05150, partial [Cytophagales bacterium]|nr:hypothetical protein [Cytophagales bacterium]